MRLCLVGSVVASACIGPQEGTSPIQLDQVRPHIIASPDGLLIELVEGRDATEPCPVLPDDFTARIGDLQVPIMSPGAWTGEFDGANECKVPAMFLDNPPPIADALLELGDSRRTLRCPLADELVPRSAAPIAGAAWELTAGQVATVRWSHQRDFGVFTIEGWFSQGASSTARLSTQPIAGTDQLTFTVPASLAPGSYQLGLGVLSRALFAAGECGGAGATQRQYHTFSQPITIKN